MKFVELKSKLVYTIKPGYIISGDDRYLCYNALDLIEKKLNLQYADINSVVLEGDKAFANNIVETARVFPFGDDYRLIVVREFKPKNEKQDLEILAKYFESPVETSIIVFFYVGQSDVFKNKNVDIENIVCDKLDESMLTKWVISNTHKSHVTIEEAAIKTLLLYSDYNLAKISTELEKLIGFVGDEGLILDSIVREMVVPEKEYQIYELSENITKQNREKTFEILQNILEKEKSTVSLITLLYNHFRRLLNVSLSNEDDNSIAAYLNVKPYAVKMMKQQTKYFSSKTLRKIVSLLAELELNSKSGKINGDNAIVFAICNILLIG